MARICWIFVLALAARKTIFARSRDLSEYAAIDGFAALEIGLVGLSCLFLVTHFNRLRSLRALRGTSLKWLLIFYGVCMASAAWSPNPAYSLFQALEVVSQTLLVLLALSVCRSYHEAEQKILLVTSIVIAMGMCVHLKSHGLSFSLRHWHTNTYTISSAMLFCYAVSESLRASGRRATMLRRYAFLGGSVTLLGTSAASYIAALGGLVITSLLVSGKRWPLAIFLALLFAVAFFNPDAATGMLFPDKTAEQISTLHGRAKIWGQFGGLVMESPWIGHGFAMGSKLGAIRLTNTHNALFSVLLAAGAFGFLTVLAASFILLREVIQANRLRLIGAVGCASAVATGLANSMSMAFLGEAWREPTLVFTAFLCFHIINLQGATSRQSTCDDSSADGRSSLAQIPANAAQPL